MPRLVIVLAAGLVSCLAGGRAEAQWGWGLGGPYAIGGGPTSYETVNYLNQRSLAAGNAAYAQRASGAASWDNSNAYYHHVRDDSFLPRYNVSSRRSIESRAASLSSLAMGAAVPRASGGAPRSSRPQPPPLTSFFDAMGRLVWPQATPSEGDLAMGRKRAGDTAESVRREVKDQGYASVGLVTDARTQLVEFGRPALTYLQAHTAPTVADGFHRFLLSLYDALEKAAYQQGR